MGYNIMPRSTVESIVEQWNRTLELYAAADESLAEARDAIVRAGKSLMTVSRERSSYTYHSEDARRPPERVGERNLQAAPKHPMLSLPR